MSKNILRQTAISSEKEELVKALQAFIDDYKKQQMKNDSLHIPVSVFSQRRLGCLEAAVKYLKENLSLKYVEIAKMLNRDERTIWTTYNKARKKSNGPFEISDHNYNVPYTIFSDRDKGPLEALVYFLKEGLELDFKEIAQLLNRNYNTIWLSYNKIKRRCDSG